MSEKKERQKRYVVSLNPDMEDLIKQVQAALQKGMPTHVGRVKVSKAIAVEAAIKEFLKK